jgi:hypothetical protein
VSWQVKGKGVKTTEALLESLKKKLWEVLKNLPDGLIFQSEETGEMIKISQYSGSMAIWEWKKHETDDIYVCGKLYLKLEDEGKKADGIWWDELISELYYEE